MPRIRTIKPAFFSHEALFDAEIEEGLPLRVAFVGLWTASDREGRFVWRPRQLKLACLPYDELDFSRVLDALAARQFIVQYEADGELFGFIPSWSKHQVINNREAQSDIPPPPENIAETITLTRAARVPDASLPPLKHAQAEGKGKEGKGRRIKTQPPSAPGGVSEQSWQDWQKARKAKGLPLTESALEAVRREAVKAKLTLAQAITMAAENSWAGFKAEWVKVNGHDEKPWHKSASGIREKGKEFGLTEEQFSGDWLGFRSAVYQRAGVSA